MLIEDRDQLQWVELIKIASNLLFKSIIPESNNKEFMNPWIKKDFASVALSKLEFMFRREKQLEWINNRRQQNKGSSSSHAPTKWLETTLSGVYC